MIIDADADGRAYGLRLPGIELPPGNGRDHYHRCLRTLAVFAAGGCRTWPLRPLRGWRAPGIPAVEQTSIAQLLWLLSADRHRQRTTPRQHCRSGFPGSSLIAAVWRLGAALKRWPLPGRILRATLTLGSALAVGFTYRQISGLDAGSALLLLMLALKLLETHSARDRSLVVLIAWFVLFAAFLREQSLGGVPLLAAGVVVGTLALLQAARTDSSALPPLTGLLLTGRLLLHAVPLALALFLLFPRLPGRCGHCRERDTTAAPVCPAR